ncbi:DUF429 domain-containing protein [Actinopolymorpha alba]|uniref:DUF429 domain-containing protein n=1 Tax=Actinopolymorpha alba TaxID=533267 RepID=UPI00035D690C|nr:DUF429 domain-containing protein [Actinopolymorpha alba]
MRTIGVDLAASPKTTALSTVLWRGGVAYVDPPHLRCTDDQLLALFSGLEPGDRVGVDCPFGWPVAFMEAVRAHAGGAPWPGRELPSEEHRRTLWFRETDRWVRRETGRNPLSVSFDRLGAVTARWAYLADALAEAGIVIDRAGAGAFIEVYPAATRRRWGLGAVRSLPDLEAAAPWLRMGEEASAVYAVHEHAFDALIASLAARSAALGLTTPPPAELGDQARVEGWIHLPEPDALGRLAAPSPRADL